jgi:manganese/zinc/iron transport system substrate-binding protein
MIHVFKKTFAVFIIIVLSAGCTPKKQSGERPQIVCTTGMLADALQSICGNWADVTALMGAGVDPHLYKASQGDTEKLSNADLIVYNGLHLEGKMEAVLKKLASRKKVIPLGEYLSPASLLPTGDAAPSFEKAGSIDPHIWMDLPLWKSALEKLHSDLMQQFPEHKAEIAANYKKYAQSIDSIHSEMLELIKAIPANQRLMITSHDAFRYFGRAYTIEVKGLQGISTVSELGLQDITQMVNLLSTRKINAVFVESSVSDKAIASVIEGCAAKGHTIKKGGTLFSDAPGNAGTPEATYCGMMLHNARTIAGALNPQP